MPQLDPTEAQIKEQIKKLDFDFPASIDGEVVWVRKKLQPEQIDQILSLTLRRGGGVCKICKDSYTCPHCHKTGKLPVEEKSIKDILGGWLDEN